MLQITLRTIAENKPEEGSVIIWFEKDAYGEIVVQVGEVDMFGDDELPDIRVNGITLHENGLWVYISELEETVENL